MKPYKLKAENTSVGKPVYFNQDEGKAFTLQSIYYSSNEPAHHLEIYDKDGDPVSFPMPGQVDPKVTSVPETTVVLPISIVDEAGGNTVILRGYLS